MMRIGILGLGEGRSTMSAVLQSPKLELLGVCDLNEELSKRRAKEFNFQNYTTNYQDLLEDDAIDIIAIYTPTSFMPNIIKWLGRLENMWYVPNR